MVLPTRSLSAKILLYEISRVVPATLMEQTNQTSQDTSNQTWVINEPSRAQGVNTRMSDSVTPPLPPPPFPTLSYVEAYAIKTEVTA